MLPTIADSSKPAYALRAPVAEDLPALHALDRACFPPDICYTRAELQHFLFHPSSHSIVLCDAASIVGFAIARMGRRRVALRDVIAPALHVITIDVDPRQRRRGLGRHLMAWLEREASRLGAQAIALEAAVDNYDAHKFYSAAGFTVTGTIPGYYNAILDAYTMERLVSPELPVREALR